MATMIGSSEAARLLGVSPATLYAYVSRGRIARKTGADGRTSLFDVDDVHALAARSRRGPVPPRPTIDVRVASTITSLSEDDVTVRGESLPTLARHHSFESIAELLWTGTVRDVQWPASNDRAALADISALGIGDSLSRMAVAAHRLGDLHPDDDAVTAARRLLCAVPVVLGARRARGSIAHRVASTCTRTPSAELVEVIDTALGVLADHELATSTLAVRVAASVRTPPMAAYATGLAVVSGPLHGRAASEAHTFLVECADSGVTETVAAYRAQRRLFPGFGHKVYRGPDPRFAVLLDAVRSLGNVDLVDEVLAEVGRVLPKHPNVDLALGALTWRAGIDATIPLFGIARIAGWAAHYLEELDAPPVRYRGVTS